MYQRDYLLRMMEDFFRFLSILLKFKENGNYPKALEIIQEASEKLLKVNVNEFTEHEELFLTFLADSEKSPEMIEVMAELLKVKAEIHLEQHQIFSAIHAYEMALKSFQEWEMRSRNFSQEKNNKMAEIRYQLEQLREINSSSTK